jgi:uncharacterized membrane protein
MVFQGTIGFYIYKGFQRSRETKPLLNRIHSLVGLGSGIFSVITLLFGLSEYGASLSAVVPATVWLTILVLGFLSLQVYLGNTLHDDQCKHPSPSSYSVANGCQKILQKSVSFI